ncbi:TPA: deoxyribose-phosphate aldolase [candidate division WOR-3 bacterium]|jgi:deoxyribose-phosphate aldolase|uniref:Deoxyribose-phosphate aldolase n=1 Tax=candidate division WOR-3 bacterium TaxID=2052148 RepID=A0A350H9M1_UNCW3|nr:deoxyribose-phosphate aldolase [candidate division WOR-3 bacterium]
MKINRYIDHTLLKAEQTDSDISLLCGEAVKYEFYSVCVNPCWVSSAKNFVKHSNVKVVSVVGFPLGANRMEVKMREAVIAVEDGADEIDMVMNIGEFKSGNYESVLNEIIGVREAVSGKILKVIVETSLLTENEKAKALEIVIKSKADFIKTSTGFSTGGALVSDIELFHRLSSGKVKIKASGKIRDYKTAEAMIKAGASRIGTSSSILIMAQADECS